MSSELVSAIWDRIATSIEPATSSLDDLWRVWKPQEGPQAMLLESDLFEIFYGGARGGGKTDGMLGDWAKHSLQYGSKARGVFFRRSYPHLEEVISRSKEIYPHMGAEWRASTRQWYFPNGSTLRFRHLWNADAADDYLGHQYTWMCLEELTQWPDPGAFDKIVATLRSAHGVKVKLRSTGNPGGPGHNWVKARYIDTAPPLTEVIDPVTKQPRMFIPAKLEDNPLLTNSDPYYENRLMASGPDALVQAWRWGNWDIVAGGYFDDIFAKRVSETEIGRDRIIVEPFKIPESWSYRRSFDWGSAAPSSLGIWAVSDGTSSEDGRFFPRGSLVRVSEMYLVDKDEFGRIKPNKGLRVPNDELGRLVAQLSYGRAFSGCVADPSIFHESGGPSIYKQVRDGAKSVNHYLHFREGDNNRIAGWQRMRDMLIEATKDHPEKPGLWIFSTCDHWIRTVPILARSDKMPDDIDTEAEDHAADETRYACMSTGSKMHRVKIVFGG